MALKSTDFPRGMRPSGHPKRKKGKPTNRRKKKLRKGKK